MMKYALFSTLLFFLSASFAYAVSDTFDIRLLVGGDTVPPTTPTALTATPITQTQIDLSWGTSTDDFIFGGYQVFRDALQIATTTLTAYSDSGLTADTTYTYFVRAYDNFLNISSSSNSVATTTFPITPTSTPTTTVSSTGNAQSKLELVSFLLIPSQNSASVQWKTNHYAQFELQWGRSSSYELGFVASNLFTKENKTLITDLQPGTVYSYQLVGHGKDGRTIILKEGQFTTLDSPDTKAPTNVSNLQAYVEGNDVRLTWDNPKDSDFSYVRIVRSYLFYPTDPYDGYLIYQDSGEQTVDRDALLQKDFQYYTVFSYDKKGNISSGAVVTARSQQQVTKPIIVASSTISLQLSDVELVQEGVLVENQSINADIPLTFRIAYEKLPEHLKTITVALTHPENSETEFSFILKINKDKTYYEATVSPLEVAGLYPLSVSVFDYQLKQLYTAEDSILVMPSDKKNEVFGIPLSIKEKKSFPEIMVLIWFLLLWLFLYMLYRASKFVSFERKTSPAFNRMKLAFSVLLCVSFGGISAYMLTKLGYSQPADGSVVASLWSGTTLFDSHNFISTFIFVAVLIFVTFVLVKYFLKKK